MEDKELFWENLLSRDPEKVKVAWRMLPEEYRKDVRGHLVSIVTELDWHPEQVKSAEAALNVIDMLKEE